MILSGRILKEKIRYLSEDSTITKEDLIDILYMSIEEGLSVEEAISDFPLEGFDEILKEELELIMEYNENVYDQMKSEGLLE